MSKEEAMFVIPAETLAALSEYQATGKPSDQLKAVASASKLVRDLQKPADYIYNLFCSPVILMSIKIAHDLGIFSALSTAKTGGVSCQELAAMSTADVALVARIMRALACGGFAEELGPGKYSATNLSQQMLDRASIGPMDALFLDFIPIFHQTPDFLKKTGYKNPGDPVNGPFQHAYNTRLSCWDWLAQNEKASNRFNTFMEGNRGDIPHWADWFPVQEVLLADAIPDGAPLLVDVGGGRGHDLVGFKDKFPYAKGQLVLEDLPTVLRDTTGLDEEIKLVEHDFFTPQPIKGARVYYLKHILHDWSDDNCKIILQHIADAMERGYSKILIEEYILLDQNASPRHILTDLIVMAWCPGSERTREQWSHLLQSAGLIVKKFWVQDGDGHGIIEAELAEPPKPVPYNVTANETQPVIYSHINGSQADMLDRFCVSELCKGWPVYRDASEWKNYRDLFTDEGAYVWTTWSGCLGIDEFIRVSKEGRKRGDFIMHRENSTLVDLNSSKHRAVGKMKATITQRFTLQGCSVDVECDCRFIFFCRKISPALGLPGWKVQYVKLFYEKDKMIPVDGRSVPTFAQADLEKFPEGYRYLGVAQSTLGHRVLDGLPTFSNHAFSDMYEAMGLWLEGKDVGKVLGVVKTVKTVNGSSVGGS